MSVPTREAALTARRLALSLALCTWISLAGDTVCADVVVLRNGGRIHGRWVNSDERPMNDYVIETPSGGSVRLHKSRVERVIRQRPAEIEFERVAPTFGDTVDQQWELAEWCRKRRLARQREAVLRHILQLDPNHAKARYALGYSQVGGRWLTRPEWMEEQGFEKYDGRWRHPQEIALLEAKRKKELAEKRWVTELNRYRTELGTDKPRQALDAIAAIKDPLAVRAIAGQFQKERHRWVKLLYVQALGRIASDAAVKVLIYGSLNDLDEEVRIACVDQIVAQKPPGAAEAYIKALSDKNNVRINLAAQALARLGEKSAIGPLIDSLVTTHEIVLPPAGGKSTGAMTMTFQNPTAGGTSAGSGNPLPKVGSELSTGSSARVIRRTVPNQEVLSALVVLTGGVSFSFDQRAWEYWYEAEKRKPQTLNARRD